MNPAQHSRIERERHPERYCQVKGCLWNVARSGVCKKHPPLLKIEDCQVDDLASDYDEYIYGDEPS